MKINAEFRILKAATLAVLSFAVTSIYPALSSRLDAAQVAAVVTAVKGTVQVQPAATNKLQPAKVGDFLCEGDIVKTLKRAQAAVTFTNGSIVKLNENTEFSIDTSNNIEDIGSKIKMKMGKLWSKVRPKTKFEINTPVAIVAVRGTEFETGLSGGRLDLSVFSGIVNVKNRFGEVNVEPGKKTAVSGDNAPEPPSDLQYPAKPAWQEELETKDTVKLNMADTNIVAGVQADIGISVVDANGNTNEKFNDNITVKADNNSVLFSPDGAKWDTAANISAVKGIAVLKIKCGAAGMAAVSASAEKAASGMIRIMVKSGVKNLKLNIESKNGNRSVNIRFKNSRP